MSASTPRGSKLSALGRKAEAVLKAKLAEMEKDIEESRAGGKEPKYSLTDFMKVMDRVLKLEAIRNRMADDGEGGFYSSGKKGAGE